MKSPNLEEILNQQVLDEELLEVSLSERIFRLFLIAVLAAILISAGRLFFLGVNRHEFYQERAFANANQIVVQPARRGIIFDRFGEPLVKNQSVFKVVLIPSVLPKNQNEREQFFEKLTAVLEIKPEDFDEILKNADLERFNRIGLKKISESQKIIELEKLSSPAIQIEEDYRRFYPDAEIFSHLIGYVGAVSKDDLRQRPELWLTSEIGRSGLEAFYEKELGGQPGEMVRIRDVRGNSLEEKLSKPAIAGEPLETNIDAEFQKYFYQALKSGMSRVGSPAGVGLAINLKNGEVLSLVSLPSFDSNEPSRFLNDSGRPLFNRVVSGVYNPGSTIKPLMAVAALKETVIDVKKQIFSAGYLEIPNPYNPSQPSRFLDWKPHGWVDLHAALARSSNVYFYTIGGGFGELKGLGIKKLKSYWQRFGLGQKTGIDLVEEKNGFLPEPSTKKEPWLLGDTYNVSIGQGDLLLTPLQLLNYVTAIANDGLIYQPRIKKGEPRVLVDLSELRPELEEVEQGMIDAVKKSYGTAYLLSDLPITVAAKTGSAQTDNNTKINALFVGYAPVSDPEIALLILVEDAREGSLNAIPIAKEVLLWYYENRLR